MGLKDIKAGDYIARATLMRYIESSKNKTPGIEVQFEIEHDAGRDRLSWTGWLTDRARDRTMETLVNVLGYNGSEETDAIGTFTDKNVIDTNRDVKLVIDVNDKGYPEVKFVNSLSSGKYAKVDAGGVKAGLASSGFKAAFLAAKAQSSSGGQEPAQQPPQFKKDEEIPF